MRTTKRILAGWWQRTRVFQKISKDEAQINRPGTLVFEEELHDTYKQVMPLRAFYVYVYRNEKNYNVEN